MALIQHTYFPRSLFDTDYWFRPLDVGLNSFGPTTLDIFDPFDDLDRMLGRNLKWLALPEEFIKPLQPRVPRKYRIKVDCRGFKPDSIKTEIQENKLIVSGDEGEKKDKEDFTVKQFRRTYELPKHAQTDKMVSFMTSNGNLIVEIPLDKEAKGEISFVSEMPKVSDDGK
jgi:HSP20 family molecular chaperone IbpA